MLKSKDQLMTPSVVGEPKMKKLPFVDREETIAEMLSCLERKWQMSDLRDKSVNPLYGFHAVSGGGKSYLIDEFMNLKLNER